MDIHSDRDGLDAADHRSPRIRHHSDPHRADLLGVTGTEVSEEFPSLARASAHTGDLSLEDRLLPIWCHASESGPCFGCVRAPTRHEARRPQAPPLAGIEDLGAVFVEPHTGAPELAFRARSIAAMNVRKRRVARLMPLGKRTSCSRTPCRGPGHAVSSLEGPSRRTVPWHGLPSPAKSSSPLRRDHAIGLRVKGVDPILGSGQLASDSHGSP